MYEKHSINIFNIIRWNFNLDPNLKQQAWNIVEEYIFFESQLLIGNKWAFIAKILPRRYIIFM